MVTDSPQLEEAALEEDPRWRLVERIVASSSFAKSDRLISFLLYICERSLTGHNDEINEVGIGAHLFNRPNYDPSIDGLVRSHASRLRQRLEQYFNEEGAQESLRLTIPKGGYIPVFQEQQLSPPSAENNPTNIQQANHEAVGPNHDHRAGKKPRSLAIWFLSTALLLACGFIVYLLAHARAAHVEPLPAPQRHAFWKLFLGADQNTMIVCSDTSLATLEDVTGQKVSLAGYLNENYRMHLPPTQSTLPDVVRDIGTRRYTAIADVGILTRLYQLAGANSNHLQFRYARDVRPNDLKEGSMILIGSTYSNPWVEVFDSNMNFTFRDNTSQRGSSIINRSPRSGELRQYDFNKLDASHTVYGVVALRPNLRGSGKVLLLEGTSMAGTEAAADFLFDDAHLLPFLAKIRNRDGSIPYFEVLLQSSSMNGSASQLVVLAYRTSSN
ncbi:hypothetical protein [Terriglobus albidus]|uniref:hypothetical protein n=1 Tax=Terriglobus albidus TaxID=1592106 RepID=UPI0021DFB2A2|nr:hypothetical protein [Terriglobus albidus]